MKTFYKIINGNKTYKKQNEIIIINGEFQIINPTESQILEDGWVEYVPNNSNPTEEELLSKEKKYKKINIEHYDTSNSINQFYVQDIPVWIDKADRAGLLLRFQAEHAVGVEDTTLWYNGMQFPLKVTQAIQMLYAIEIYASACYDNTQKHLSEIDKLTTIEDVRNYNYKTGYPEKLRF